MGRKGAQETADLAKPRLIKRGAFGVPELRVICQRDWQRRESKS